MAAAAPPVTPASASASKAPPVAAPPPRPRVPDLRDDGAVRHDTVDADRWAARGLVKVTGDANVGDGTLDGTVTIGGKLSANSVRYRGTVEVDGPVQVGGAVSGAGTLRAGQTFHAGEAKLKGTVKVSRAASVDGAFAVHGSLAAPSLAVGSLALDGEAQIPGELTGTTVSARLAADSTFGSIRARSVSLRARAPNLVEMVFWGRIQVSAERVEGDEVELEGVEVQFVRAPKITLGRNAHVTQYEGTIVRRHASSRVGFESKSRPPYGLRR